MPVIGHAFVGLATALAVDPTPAGRSEASPRPVPPGAVLWVPIVVGLAYVPDLIMQALIVVGYGNARRAAHSLVLAVPLAWLAAAALAWLGRLPFRRSFLVALGSILAHDVLDLLQAGDRMALWPLSYRRLGGEWPIIPSETAREAWLFAAAFLVFLAGRWLWRGVRAGGAPLPPAAKPARGLLWLNRLTIAAFMIAAVGTHYLRSTREARFRNAVELLERRDYAAALEGFEAVQGWPFTARPGRVDYLKATALLGLGDRRQAELHYLSAVQREPHFFWALADLMLFYASGPEPVATRRRIVTPWVATLRSEFPRAKKVPAVLARIERLLAGAEPPGPDVEALASKLAPAER